MILAEQSFASYMMGDRWYFVGRRLLSRLRLFGELALDTHTEQRQGMRGREGKREKEAAGAGNDKYTSRKKMSNICCANNIPPNSYPPTLLHIFRQRLPPTFGAEGRAEQARNAAGGQNVGLLGLDALYARLLLLLAQNNERPSVLVEN